MTSGPDSPPRRPSVGSWPAWPTSTEVAERLVTTAPDVSISTNLGGWINKVGVYAPTERDDHGGADRLLKWAPSPTGQHIELGISEMNLFMLLGQLGLAHEHHGQPPAPGRRGLRPLRATWPGRPHLLALQRCPLRGRRHPLRGDAGPRGRGPPVDHHPIGRPRTARPDLRRAGLRHRGRLAPVRRHRRARPDQTGRLTATSACRPGRSTRPRSPEALDRHGEDVAPAPGPGRRLPDRPGGDRGVPTGPVDEDEPTPGVTIVTTGVTVIEAMDRG